MRVLVIAQYYPPDMGGGATRAENAVKGLLKAGCDVTVVSAFPHYPTGIIPKNYKGKAFVIERTSIYKIIRTYMPGLASAGFFQRLILFMSFIVSSLFAIPYVGKVDIVWVSNPNVLAMIPGYFYSRLKRVPLVQNVDDLWPEALYDLGVDRKSIMGRLGEIMARLMYNLSTAITPISPAYVPTLRKKYGISEDRIEVIRAGVDIDRFSGIEQSDSLSDKFQVLYIGAFSPAYDFDQVFKAAELTSSSSDIEYIIQGGGELADELEQKAKLSKNGNIHVISKIVSRNKVADLLEMADVLLLPLCGIGSIEMGISSKLYEYQAAGKPIICCSRGQPGSYVSESRSGIVVEPGDAKALADAVLYLKENPEEAKILGTNGQVYVRENMTIQKMGERMKQLFYRLKN